MAASRCAAIAAGLIAPKNVPAFFASFRDGAQFLRGAPDHIRRGAEEEQGQADTDAVATTQAAQTITITPNAVYGAGIVTGIIWFLLGITGAVKKVADVVSRPVAVGIVLGLGFSFMLFFSGSVETIFKIFPAPILGVILFLTGAQLALGSCDFGKTKNDRFVSLVTAGCAIWNIGLAFVLGVATYHLLKRGWVKL